MGALESEASNTSTHSQQQQRAQTVESSEAVQFPPQNPHEFPIPTDPLTVNPHHHDHMQSHLRHDNHPFPSNAYHTPSPNIPIATTYIPQPHPQPVSHMGHTTSNIPASGNLTGSNHYHHHSHHHQHHQVLTAPVLPVLHRASTELWTTGLFDCMDDPMTALIACCIPCLTFGQIAEIIDSGNTSCATSGLIYGAILFLIGCPCILSCTYRTKLRSRFNLVESAGPDWISHFLCECCALTQEYRELKNRGLDPSIGWNANVARSQSQQYQVAMVPPTNQTMRG